jgi:hypothetical protein
MAAEVVDIENDYSGTLGTELAHQSWKLIKGIAERGNELILQIVNHTYKSIGNFGL